MKTASGVGFPSDAAGGGRTVGAQLSSYTHVASVAQFVRTPAHHGPRTSRQIALWPLNSTDTA